MSWRPMFPALVTSAGLRDPCKDKLHIMQTLPSLFLRHRQTQAYLLAGGIVADRLPLLPVGSWREMEHVPIIEIKIPQNVSLGNTAGPGEVTNQLSHEALGLKPIYNPPNPHETCLPTIISLCVWMEKGLSLTFSFYLLIMTLGWVGKLIIIIFTYYP